MPTQTDKDNPYQLVLKIPRDKNLSNEVVNKKNSSFDILSTWNSRILFTGHRRDQPSMANS